MELTREHFLAIICHNFRCELLILAYIDELKSLYDHEAPFYCTVKNWFNDFNFGRRSLKDEVRECCPKTAVSPKNIDTVRKLIAQDHHVTNRDIDLSLGILPTNIEMLGK